MPRLCLEVVGNLEYRCSYSSPRHSVRTTMLILVFNLKSSYVSKHKISITLLIYQNVMTRLLPSTAKLQLFAVHVNRFTVINPIIFIKIRDKSLRTCHQAPRAHCVLTVYEAQRSARTKTAQYPRRRGGMPQWLMQYPIPQNRPSATQLLYIIDSFRSLRFAPWPVTFSTP